MILLAQVPWYAVCFEYPMDNHGKEAWAMRNLMQRLWKDESGLTILEYGIAAAMLAVIVVALMKVFGKRLAGYFEEGGTDPKTAAEGVVSGGN